jgi:hypothetical protein
MAVKILARSLGNHGFQSKPAFSFGRGKQKLEILEKSAKLRFTKKRLLSLAVGKCPQIVRRVTTLKVGAWLSAKLGGCLKWQKVQ